MMNSSIIEYNTNYEEPFEIFREKALLESPGSLTKEKLNVRNLSGQLLLSLDDQGQIFSCSYAEPSDYTGDPDIACRICRYHILKPYREHFTFAGFRMLKHHCFWADSKGFKVVYWTHDVKNKALNSLYNNERRYGFGVNSEFFHKKPFTEFYRNPDYLFQVSEKSELLQYIYQRVKSHYSWHPIKRVVEY
jgi:hypothetical protein